MERRGQTSRSLAERLGRGEIAPVYCLHGEDDYRREEALEQLLDALLIAGGRDLNLEQIRPEEAETGSILGSARTLPFLSARRVILIRGAETLSREQQEELLAYLNDPSPTTCLVLAATRLDLRTRLAAAIQKKGVILRFDRLEADSLKASLLAAVKERGKRLSPEAIDLLITLTGDDLRQLMYSVEKAALFAGEREEIEVQDIEAMVGETRARSIFELTDAVGARDLDVALRCLAGLLESGEEPLAILGMLARQVRLLIRVKALQEQGISSSAMPRTLGLRLPHRVIAGLAEQCASLSWQQLLRALRSLSGADLAIKTGKSGAPAVLNRLLWALCEA